MVNLMFTINGSFESAGSGVERESVERVTGIEPA